MVLQTGYPTLFNGIFTASALQSAFFAFTCVFKPFTNCMSWNGFFSRSFSLKVKVLVHIVNIWVINQINAFWNKHELLFPHQCPAYIAHNTTYLVCWFNVKVKGNFDGIWYNLHDLLNHAVFQCQHVDLGRPCLVMLTLAICSLLSLKANCIVSYVL